MVFFVNGYGATATTDSPTTNIYGPGIYASYIASDPSLLCGRPDTLFFQFEVQPKIEASFSLGPVCDEEAIQPVLTAGSFNAIEWRFGDGKYIQSREPKPHL